MSYKLPTKPGLKPPEGSATKPCGTLPPKTGGKRSVTYFKLKTAKRVTMAEYNFSVWLPTREEN